MSVNTSAAQAAVTGHHGEEASAAVRSLQGALAGRQVAEQPESRRILSPHAGRRLDGESVAGAGRSIGTRLVRAIRSAMRLPEARVEAPRDTPLRAPPPERSTASPDVPESPLQSPARQNVARVQLLPWLTPGQNAVRLLADRVLGELRDRRDVPPEIRANLCDAMELVAGLEGHVMRADELLNRSRTEILTEPDWRELATLVSSNRQRSSVAKPRLQELLGEFAREGALVSPVRFALQQLCERVTGAERHLLSNDMRWDDTVRCVETRLPVGPGLPVVVHSRVVEGSAIGAHLAQGYPAQDADGRQDATRYSHVRELALTSLVGANGEKLFAGVRHASFHAGELTPQYLQALAEDDLRAWIDNLVVGDRGAERVGQTRTDRVRDYCDDMRAWIGTLVVDDSGAERVGRTRADRVREYCKAIRRFDGVAAGCTLIVAHESRKRMALETAAAALIADSEKFRRALAGETVELNLHCVALMGGEGFGAWSGQFAEFDRLARSSPVALQVCDMAGTPRLAWANVEVRQTAVWVDGEQRRVVGRPRREVGRLLGPPATAAPGGAVGSRMEDMLFRASALAKDIDTLGTRYMGTCAGLGTEHPVSVALLARRCDLQEERERLVRNAGSLKEVATQLKQIWAEHDGWPSGAAAYEQVLPRLVLLGYWMGETPVLSCREGTFCTRRLDAEVKLLATATHNLSGQLPPLQLDARAWEQARGNFAPQ